MVVPRVSLCTCLHSYSIHKPREGVKGRPCWVCACNTYNRADKYWKYNSNIHRERYPYGRVRSEREVSYEERKKLLREYHA